MKTCSTEPNASLDLPREFEDLEGLVQNDLQALARILTQRAHERLLLTRREYHELHTRLLSDLTEAINAALEPLSADRR
jgi:hypothetical protein